MFVLKSTYDAACAQRDTAMDAAERMERRANSYLIALKAANRECDALNELIAALRAELAASYVRDAKGRMARHPSAGVVA